MSSAQSNIVTAVLAALQSGTPVAPHVDRYLPRAIAAQFTSAVVVHVQGSQFTQSVIRSGPLDVVTRIAVECLARSTTLKGERIVDTLVIDVWGRLMADTTLGGVVQDLFISEMAYEFDSDADNTASATLALEITHRLTSGANIES